MDPFLASRIESDKDFRVKMVKLAKDYLKLGRDTLSYWTADFDVAYDALMGYSPMERADYERLERGHPKRFTLPVTATQITTMATYISQVLFGQDTPHKVDARGPEDELPAEFMNQLLRWNAEQQQMYLLGYLWVFDAVGVNRGIFYNHWAPIYKISTQMQETPTGEKNPDGTAKKYWAPRRVKKEAGGYNRAYLVSPYDFICDPALPLWRLQEMRFCGHRTSLSVIDLERRSLLGPDNPQYVLPSSVAHLKEHNTKSGPKTVDGYTTAASAPSPTGLPSRVSRTAYERGRVTSPNVQGAADKHDAGNTECWEMWVRLVPKDYGIHEGTEPVEMQFLIAGHETLLAMNESTYDHGQYPYSVAEGRPCAHFQFSPGWVMMLKGIQDHVDWLKNRHQEALQRTVGNVFIVDPSMVDTTDFMNPEKEGLLIPLKPDAYGKKISDVIQQVPIKDLTEHFHEEMMQFVAFSETVTAANSSMQGAGLGEDPSATQFAGTQQMSAGRMTSIARLLSVQGLVPQTRMFVANFQQFMTQAQRVRFHSDRPDLPAELAGAFSVELNRDVIQGDFDYIAHDGTLPGTDSRKVAAGSKLLEAVPLIPQVFTPAPGNIDPRQVIFAVAKAAGLNVESLTYRPNQLPPNGAAGGGGQLPPGAAQAPSPGTAQPATPLGGPPGPSPATPMLPDLAMPGLSPVGPPQARPQNI